MVNKTLIVVALLGVGMVMGMVTHDVMAQKLPASEFATDKTDRMLIKDILIKQNELKGMIQGIDQKIGRLGICAR